MFMPPEGLPKEEWGPGPWQDEPDELTWTDESTGYKCHIRRTWMGSLCGYVGLSEGHRLYGKSYSYRFPTGAFTRNQTEIDQQGAIPLMLESMQTRMNVNDGCLPLDCLINVHGSITFSNMWPDLEDGLWYMGFDCGHCDDYQPGLIASTEKALDHFSPLREYGTYRTIEYVKDQCRELARQLHELS